MTPDELRQYLDTMRAAGCMSAELIIPSATIRAVFAPPEPDFIGTPIGGKDEPKPGGWKEP